LAKIVITSIGWRDTVILSYVGGLAAFLLYLLFNAPRTPASSPSIWVFVAIVAGALGFLGTPAFYAALDYNPSSIVVVITSLYPLIAVALSALFLNESITTTKAVGISFALAALVLLSLES